MLQHFTTGGYAAADRHDAWVNRAGPGIGRLFDAEPIGAFDMWSEHLALGAVSVHFGGMSAQGYIRPAELCRRDHVDLASFCLMWEGTVQGEAGDRTYVGEAGALVCADLGQPNRHHSTASRTALINMPRNVAQARFGPIERLHGLVVAPAANRLLTAHLKNLRREADSGLADEALDPLGRSVLDLLEVSLALAGHRGDDALQISQATLKFAAMQEIERTLAWPGLDAEHLCGRLNLSRSSLYRLFEAEGGVHAVIRRARLDRIHAALSTSDNAETIAELAARWGFSDRAHLSRLFRQAYGLPPSAMREDRA